MANPRRALVLIDVQQEYFTPDGPLAIQYPPRDKSLEQTLAAIDAANSAQVPVVVVRHEYPEGAPVFGAGSPGAQLHPEVAERVKPEWRQSTKNVASIFSDDDLVQWLRDESIDTVTFAGYMTNNCVIGSAAAAEPLGIAVEVLSDATGAIHLTNEAGSASAQQIHETLMTLLHSNFAAVAQTSSWIAAVGDGSALPKSDLGTSAMQGRAAH